MPTAIENFRAAMRAAGLDFAGPIRSDGKLHRFKAAGDKERNSWVVLHAGPPMVGAFGCWKRGLKENWHDRTGKDLSQADWQKSREAWRKAEAAREQAEADAKAKAQKTAAYIWGKAGAADGNAYLAKKRVKATPQLRQYKGALLVPLRDATSKLHSLQFIGADGEKKFLRGGHVAGCFFTVADWQAGALVIAEGIATALSIQEATGLATVAAMNCGNLLAVAKALRATWPEREIILAADNDQFTDGNPGLAKATDAAKAVRARLAVPKFRDTANKPTDFNDLHQIEGLDTVKKQITNAQAPTEAPMQADDDWPTPKPLPDDLPAVQPFNFDCLPDTLRPWLEDISERMQCPPDFAAVSATIALGSLIGRKVGIRPKRQDDWLVVPNLWGMTVGRPGLMKTPATENALAPLKRLVADAQAKYDAETATHEVCSLLDKQRAKLAESAISGLLKKGEEQAAFDLAASNLKNADTAPVLRRYVVNDSTVEKLGELLNQNPNGVLLYRDELVGFLRSLDKEGREDSRAFYLEAWNGTGAFTCDRIGRGTVRIEAVTVSIIGAIQPGPLADYLRQAVRSGLGDDGLLQRFQLTVWPDVAKDWRNVDRWPDTAAKNEAFAVFQYLDTLTPVSVGAEGTDGIPFLRFAPGAQNCFAVWRADLEKRLRSDCEHPAFEAHLAKYRKLVPALALICHLANRDIGPVTLPALEKALLWANYLESHARRIYCAVLRPDSASARELAKHLQRGDLANQFTLREAYRKGWTGLATKEDAEAATEILSDLGWLRPVHSVGPANGRPASPTFEVHPQICELPALGTDRTDITLPVEVLSVASVAPTLCVENSPAFETEPELAHADLL